MLNSFEVSPEVNEKYSYNFRLNDELVINYHHSAIFNRIDINNCSAVCYGYSFDVRKPEISVKDTLRALLKEPENILHNIKYLNGHFILLFKVDGCWKLVTDATSITPIYFDTSEHIVTTSNIGELQSINGISVLNLEEFTVSRIKIESNKLTDERIERIILDLVSKQYKYFMNKDITLNFRRNKMNKAIISIMHPSLIGQTLNLRENDETTLKLSKWISREYKMKLLSEEIEPSTKYLCNTHLMDYISFMKKESGLSSEVTEKFTELYKLNDDYLKSRSVIEYNLINRLKYRLEVKSQLIFDPFNVLAIQEVLYGFNDKNTFDPLARIIKILHPAIDFYDFAEGITLVQKYNKLKKQNKRMSEELKRVKFNEEFLQKAEEKGISVSENLDGKVLDKGLTFHPASQSIIKGEIYEITYVKQGVGMILVETYFNNPRNAHRIKINLNDDLYNIDEFLDGKFIKVDKELKIKMYYERDYDAASWQKAGRITVKEID